MQFKKIVGFGDSWMYGDELADRSECFLSRIGSYYNIPTENFGIMGGSLQSAIWTFLWWLEHEPDPESCLILHGLTNDYRFSYYNPNHVQYLNDPPWNRFVHSSWPPSTAPAFEMLIKQQTVLTDSPELRSYNYQQALLLFDGVAARRFLTVFQFNIFQPGRPIDADTLVYPNENLRDWLEQKGPEYFCLHKHPNELGHNLIAQHLINQIDPAIIAI